MQCNSARYWSACKVDPLNLRSEALQNLVRTSLFAAPPVAGSPLSAWVAPNYLQRALARAFDLRGDALSEGQAEI